MNILFVTNICRKRLPGHKRYNKLDLGHTWFRLEFRYNYSLEDAYLHRPNSFITVGFRSMKL